MKMNLRENIFSYEWFPMKTLDTEAKAILEMVYLVVN